MKLRKQLTTLACWALLSSSGDADPSSVARGVLILRSSSGFDLGDVLFTHLAWTSFYGGIATDTTGQTSSFANKDVSRILYFDAADYSALDNDSSEKAFRAGIQVREIVANTSLFNLVHNDAEALGKTLITLEALEAEQPAVQLMIQPKVDVLNQDIAKLLSGQVMVAGKWMTAQEASIATDAPIVGDRSQQLTFTTRDGRRFENATVDLTDTGLSVLTSSGGTTILFDQLPDNLSNFSPKIRDLARQNAKRKPICVSAQSDAATPSDQAPSFDVLRIEDTSHFPAPVTGEGLGPEQTIDYINNKLAPTAHMVTYNPLLQKFLIGPFRHNSAGGGRHYIPSPHDPLIEFEPADLSVDDIQQIMTAPDPRGGLWDMMRIPYQLEFSTIDKEDILTCIPSFLGKFHNFRVQVDQQDDLKHLANAFAHLIELFPTRRLTEKDKDETDDSGSDLPIPKEGDQRAVAKVLSFLNIQLKDSRWHCIYDKAQNAFSFTYQTLGGQNELLFHPGDFDPESVKSDTLEDGIYVHARTTNGKGSVRTLLGNNTGQFINIDVPSQDDADKVCEALKKLIIMYGGKMDDF